MASEDGVAPTRHRLHEDIVAVLMGTLVVALGIALYSQATLGTGGTAGLALLLQYLTGWSFGLLFFLINLPFYGLALLRLGWMFTLRTFVAVSLLSGMARLTPQWIGIDRIAPLYAAIAGGALIGLGILILIRHRASLGGFNVVALYFQERHGLRAGYVQLGLDALVLAAALFILPPEKVALSLVGAVVINMVLALNHRPGRYMGVS